MESKLWRERGPGPGGSVLSGEEPGRREQRRAWSRAWAWLAGSPPLPGTPASSCGRGAMFPHLHPWGCRPCRPWARPDGVLTGKCPTRHWMASMAVPSAVLLYISRETVPGRPRLHPGCRCCQTCVWHPWGRGDLRPAARWFPADQVRPPDSGLPVWRGSPQAPGGSVPGAGPAFPQAAPSQEPGPPWPRRGGRLTSHVAARSAWPRGLACVPSPRGCQQRLAAEPQVLPPQCPSA